MIIKNKDIYELIGRLHEHYSIFFSNQFIKYYLLDSRIPKSIWINIEDLMSRTKEQQASGYELEKLYEQIMSFASFLQTIRKEVIPRMMDEAQRRMTKMATDSKILFKMTLDNAPGNLEIFDGLISELYIAVRAVDTEKNGEDRSLYRKLPYTRNIEEILHLS